MISKLSLFCGFIQKTKVTWLVWPSGLSAGLQTKELLVQFPVNAQVWVAGQVPGGVMREATTY